MKGIYLALASLIVGCKAAAEVYLSKPFAERWAVPGDEPRIVMSEHIMGSGKGLYVTGSESLKPTAISKYLGEMSFSSKNCKGSVHVGQQVLSICDDNKISMVDFSDPASNETVISLGDELTCFDMINPDPLGGALVICQKSDTTTISDIQLISVFVQEDPEVSKRILKIGYSASIPVTAAEDLRVLRDGQRLRMLIDKKENRAEQMIAIFRKEPDRSSEFKIIALKITGKQQSDIKYIGYFENGKKLKSEITDNKDCKMLGINIANPTITFAVWCASKKQNFYLTCTYPTTQITCDSKKTLTEDDLPKIEPLALLRDYTGSEHQKVFITRGNSILEIDLREKSVDKVFELTDFKEVDNSGFQAAAIYGNMAYIIRTVVEHPKLLFLLSINIGKNYYVPEIVWEDLDPTEVSTGNLRIIFDQDLFGGSLPQLFIVTPSSGKVLAYQTLDWLIEPNMDAIQLKNENNQPWNDTLVGQALSTNDGTTINYAFPFHAITDLKKVMKFNPIKEWKIYKGKKYYRMPIAKEDFSGYDAKLVASGTNLKLISQNFEQVNLKMEGNLTTFQVLAHSQGQSIYASTEDEYYFLKCNSRYPNSTTTKPELKCSVLFAQGLQEGERVLSYLFIEPSIYVLYKSVERNVGILQFDMEGNVKNNKTFSVASEQGQLRDFSNIIFLEITANLNERSVMYYTSFKEHDFPTEDLKVFDDFFEGTSSMKLRRGPRKLNSAFIEANFNDRMVIFDIHYNMLRSPYFVTTSMLKEDETDVFTCYFTRYFSFLDPKKLRMVSVSRASDPGARRVYPLADFDIKEVKDYTCDYDNSHMIVQATDIDFNTVLIILRVDENHDEALHRIHTIAIPNNQEFTMLASLGSIEPDAAIILTGVNVPESLEAYMYQVNTPKITLEDPALEIGKTYSFDLNYSVSVGENHKIYASKITMINQDTAVSIKTEKDLPQSTVGTHYLDNWLAIDGLGVQIELLGSSESAGTVNIHQRVQPYKTTEVYNFRASYAGVITNGALYFGWSKTDGDLYEMVNDKLEWRYSAKLKGLRDCWFVGNTPNAVSCFKRDNDKDTTEFMFIRKTDKNTWIEEGIMLNFQVKKMKSFMIEQGVYAYAMIDINYEVLNIGAVMEEDGMIVPAGRVTTIVTTERINAFDAFLVENRLVVAFNERQSKIIGIHEYAYDRRLERMATKRTHDLPIFDETENPDFSLPYFLKCDSIKMTNGTSVLCYAHHGGVYSYTTRQFFPASKDPINTDGVGKGSSPEGIYSNKVYNVQGFSAKRIKHMQGFTAVVYAKDYRFDTFAPGIEGEVFVAVYKHYPWYNHPFAVVSMKEFNLKASQADGVELSSKIENADLVLTIYANPDGKTNSIKRYIIKPLAVEFAKDSLNTLGKGRGINFKNIDSTQSKIMKMQELFTLTGSNEPDGKTQEKEKKPFMTILAIVIALLIIGAAVIGIYAYRMLKKVKYVDPNDPENAEESTEKTIHGGHDKSVGDRNYQREDDYRLA